MVWRLSKSPLEISSDSPQRELHSCQNVAYHHVTRQQFLSLQNNPIMHIWDQLLSKINAAHMAVGWGLKRDVVRNLHHQTHWEDEAPEHLHQARIVRVDAS